MNICQAERKQKNYKGAFYYIKRITAPSPTMYRSVPERKILSVLRSVGLERFANAQALDTIVTEGGTNFSGGEKKRICFARALLRDTDVLILDEPLANLDALTAERIEDVLLSIQNKTILIVSHQFTQAKQTHFDQVIDFTQF